MKQTEATASKLDGLFVLAALLAYAFGWAPILEFAESGVAIVVGVALLWLLVEWRFPLNGFRGSSTGWLPALTKGDVLILLFALWSSVFVFLPLLVAVVGWGVVAWARRSGQRAGADEWFHWSAILTSFVAMMIAAEAAKIWLYSGASGGAPSPLDHAGFHQFLDGAIGVSCALLFLGLAWTALREGQSGAVAALLVGGFPVAALAGWAAALAIINQRDYGYLHPYAWLLAVFWTLGILCAVRGLALQRRSPMTTDG